MLSEGEIYDALDTIYREVFSRNDIVLTPEMILKDVEGWDMFKQVDIVMALEEKFGIKFRSTEMDTLQKVRDLARSVLIKTWV
jgi:acyl carrier protein